MASCPRPRHLPAVPTPKLLAATGLESQPPQPAAVLILGAFPSPSSAIPRPIPAAPRRGEAPCQAPTGLAGLWQILTTAPGGPGAPLSPGLPGSP